MSKRFNKNILICPNCKNGKLTLSENEISCSNCKSRYRYENQKYIFTDFHEEKITDSFDKIKYFVKKHHKLYNFLVNTISPVFIDRFQNRFINEFVKGRNLTALNLGSGNSNLSDEISNVDIYKYENVDLICDIENLPIQDNSVDVIVNIATLEHVPNPEKVVGEMFRVLRKGGVILSFFPFIQGFHASPYDFSRRTKEGIKILFKDFNMTEIRICGGPTSGFLWIFQEYIAIIFSLGSKTIHNVILILLMLITFPLKYLDFIFQYFPMSENISTGFYYIGKKL